MTRRAPHNAVKWHPRVPWAAKLRPELQPRLVPDRRGGEVVLVPTPLLVAEEIRKVRRGQVIMVAELRRRLARRTGAASACPFTTGILLHIVAGAAEEQLAAGRRATAPYWRVVGNDGQLNGNWPPGPARQAEHLRAEGHRIVRNPAAREWSIESRGQSSRLNKGRHRTGLGTIANRRG